MIEPRNIVAPVPGRARDERSMKLFEYLVSSLALLAAVLLALMR